MQKQPEKSNINKFQEQKSKMILKEQEKLQEIIHKYQKNIKENEKM